MNENNKNHIPNKKDQTNKASNTINYGKIIFVLYIIDEEMNDDEYETCNSKRDSKKDLINRKRLNPNKDENNKFKKEENHKKNHSQKELDKILNQKLQVLKETNATSKNLPVNDQMTNKCNDKMEVDDLSKKIFYFL